jgi:hypothetical protein
LIFGDDVTTSPLGTRAAALSPRTARCCAGNATGGKVENSRHHFLMNLKQPYSFFVLKKEKKTYFCGLLFLSKKKIIL